MSKIGLIIGREYYTRVSKKSFLITTILVPLIFLGFYAVIIAISVRGSSEKQSIAVVDEAGLFSDSSLHSKDNNINFKLVRNESEASFVQKYKSQGYDAFLYVPRQKIDSPAGIVLHSTSAASLITSGAARSIVNNAVQDKRLQASGIDPAKYRNIAADVDIDNTIDTKEGGKKSVVAVAYAVSFACGMLIYFMMILYGTQVMRGVTEEKTNRIAEVVISSVKPFELMMGKIFGIGMVGLTQFAIWIVLIFIGQMLIPIPAITHQVSGASAGESAAMLNTMSQGLASLPLLKIGIAFIIYFLGGYLTYASLFAAVGSVVSEDQQEAQQLMFPILMPIILGFVIMLQAVNEPNSNMAVFGSLFPLTSPIVMMGRISYDVPYWQLGLSIFLLAACFLLFTWLTGKIYRTGILMYGKKPSWKEMMKWAFKRAS